MVRMNSGVSLFNPKGNRMVLSTASVYSASPFFYSWFAVPIMMKLRVWPALTALTGIHMKLLPVTTGFMTFFIFRMITPLL